MKNQVMALAASFLLVANPLFADASYTKKQTIKSGINPQMVSMLKTFGGGSIAKALDPTTDVVMVRGNKMVTVSAHGSSIMDLDKQAWIETDSAKHEYYVMTFQQMSDMMERVGKMEDSPTPVAANPSANNPQVTTETKVDISEEHPGTTKDVGGFTATEHIFKATITTLTKDATGKDPTVVTSKMFYTQEVWVLDTVPPAYQEVLNFQKLMGEKAARAMSPAARAAVPQGVPNTPDVANGMIDLQRRAVALKGLHVIEVTRISLSLDSGASAAGGARPAADQAATAQTTPTPATNSSSSSSSSAPASTSRFGGLGGALARGALGGFGSKKQATPPPSQDPAPATTTTAQNQPATANGATPFLSETTIELGNFSTQPVAASAFEVPAGYKQVPSPLEKYLNSGK
jgi:hypothetical protein